MNKKLHPLLKSILFLSILFCTNQLSAQLSGWNYIMPVSVTNTSGIPQTNYQVKITINTASIISAGHMQPGGEDIRFTDSCSTIIYNHYIDSNINSASTTIWVMIPSLPANGTENFLMHYGNALATQGSNFATTFPANQIITSYTTLTGTINVDWFEITAGDTLNIQAGAPLTINARNVIVNGTILGKGAGYAAPALNTNGNGPGAGTTSGNAGSGGGSYGGQGGLGGLDAGDTPGNGGPVYGTNNGTDVDMGSSGASGTVAGGSGGGAITISADYIYVNGNIAMDGTDGGLTASRGGGGGAGGGIMVNGYLVSLNASALIQANGGAGGPGTSTFNDGGGGGGGGRIKIFNSGPVTNLATINVNAGIGGPYGDQAHGQPGAIGTIYSDAGTYSSPSVILGSEFDLILNTSYSDTILCVEDTLHLTTESGFSYYDYLVNNMVVFSGPLNTFSFTGLNNNDTVEVIAYLNSCTGIIAQQPVTVHPPAIISYSVTPNDTVCAGDAVILTASGGGSYNWSGGITDGVSFQANSSDSYIVTGIDGNGCSGSDTAYIVANVLPAIGFTASTDTVCYGANVTLSGTGGTGYNWSGGISNGVPFPVFASASYQVTGTDANGCSNSAMANITVFNVNVNVTNNDPTLIANASGAGFQWFDCNTSTNVSGATSSSFTPSANGSYAVIVTQQGCTDTSACNLIVTLSIEDEVQNLLHIYPNPSNGNITIKGNVTGNFILCNELGQPVQMISFDQAGEIINLQGLNSGIYFIQSTDNTHYRSKIIITK